MRHEPTKFRLYPNHARRSRATVRLVARLSALIAVAGLVWSVAPALSLDPYVPEPVNFEQHVPTPIELGGAEARRLERRDDAAAETHSDEGRIRYLTESFTAPARFDLVGLVDQARPIEVRARKTGEAWSPWVETAQGEPIWTGGADELQLRSRGPKIRGELGFVNVSGSATPADRALTRMRGAVNSATVTVGSVLSASSADADPPMEIVNRREWDPDNDCVPKSSPASGKVKAAVVHHTVNSNTYTAQQAASVVLGICRYHRYSHGWNDIGYNALVDRFGNIYAGRAGGLARPIVGAHTAGFNSQTTGVAAIGTHTTQRMGKAALRAMSNYLAWKLQVHGLDGKGRAKTISSGGSGNKHPSGKRVKSREVTRHRRFNETSCPGRAQVKKIAKRVKRKIGRGDFAPAEPAPEEESPDDGSGGVLPQ